MGASAGFREPAVGSIHRELVTSPVNARALYLGVGTAITSFLLAAGMTIELLGAGEPLGIGILGTVGAVLAGLLAGGIVAASADRVSGIGVSIFVAYATFGIVFVAIAGMRSVTATSADDVFSFPIHVGTSVMVAIAVALLVSHAERREQSKPA